MLKSHFFSGTRNINVVSFRFRFYPKRSSFLEKSFFWDIFVYLIFLIWYGLIYPSISPLGYITPSPIQPNLTSDHHMSMKTKKDLLGSTQKEKTCGIIWDLWGSTRKETTKKRGYLHFWKRLETKRRDKSKRNGNVLQIPEI